MKQMLVSGSLLIASVAAQTTDRRDSDALSLLSQASQQYSNPTAYHITLEESTILEHASSAPMMITMAAARASGGRYRFEGDNGLGRAAQVSDGLMSWYYRAARQSYTERPATGHWVEYPKNSVIPPDEAAVLGAQHILEQESAFAADYKSAKKLPDTKVTINGQDLDCYTIELSNDDLRVPQPYPRTKTVWIEKKTFHFRKSVERFTMTVNQPGKQPTTFPATRTILYPEVSLNQPIPGEVFKFSPPPNSRMVDEFDDHASLTSGIEEQRANLRRHVSGLTLTSTADGSRINLDSFRGHPILLDIWATWCGPCLQGFADLLHLYRDVHQTSLVILSIDQKDDARAAQAYLQKMQYPWSNYHDDGDVDSALGAEAVPRAILLNASGEIVFDAVSATDSEIRSAVAKLGPQYAAALTHAH